MDLNVRTAKGDKRKHRSSNIGIWKDIVFSFWLKINIDKKKYKPQEARAEGYP
jgi:hypothetical protein